MTFLEKYLEEHQGAKMDKDGFPYDCPFSYGYEDGDGSCPEDADCDCERCWSREMPDAVEEEYEDPEYPFEEDPEDDEPDLRDVFPDIYEKQVFKSTSGLGVSELYPDDPKIHIDLTVDEIVELLNQGRFERKEKLGNITLEIEITDYKPTFEFYSYEDDGDNIGMLIPDTENARLKEENEELKLSLEDACRINKELHDLLVVAEGECVISKQEYDEFKETSDSYNNLEKDFDEIYSAYMVISRVYEELKIKYDELLETHNEAMVEAEIQELKYNPDLVEAVEKAFKNLGMKVVLIRHCNNTSSREAYLFEVPSDYDVKAGDHVLVNTKKGTATGICLTSSTYVNKDFVEQLTPILGGKCPLKKVIGTYHLEEFDIPEEEENV